jgi:hypothetical protein
MHRKKNEKTAELAYPIAAPTWENLAEAAAQLGLPAPL